MRSKKSSLVKTTQDFASRTTVHGIGYVFDPTIPIIDRILWLAVNISISRLSGFWKKKLQVISAFLLLAVYLTSQSFQEWNDEPVLTTLKNTALPIDKVSHPILTRTVANWNFVKGAFSYCHHLWIWFPLNKCWEEGDKHYKHTVIDRMYQLEV